MHEHEEAETQGEKSILLSIDQPGNALKLTKHIVGYFGRNNTVNITLMGIVREPSKDLFSEREELSRIAKDNEAAILAAVARSKEILREGGFLEENIQTKIVKIQQGNAAARILEEQERNHYDIIVTCATKMSKAEEFLLGSVAVKLVRESNSPVLVVH
jgi:nucleotide-binding universal stress UspA family protein